VAEELRNSASMPSAITAEQPLLLLVTGAAGAGKTTFYESKLRESFPILLRSSPSPLEQAEVERQRKELLKSHKSFVFQSSVVNFDLLKEAKSHAFDVKAIFIGTEHPDLNIARILSRVSRGGLFGPITQVSEEFEKGLHDLPAMKRVVDELMLLDNTAEGRSPRVIAQFVNGKIVKVARSIPDWAQRSFDKEFADLMAQKRLRPERTR
jgi:predicted ABC-type ATPase